MITAKNGDTVKVHYKAQTNEDEVIFDSNSLEPLKLTIGENQVIPAFEKALIGMNIGESKTVEISAKEAFGPYIKELVSTVSRTKIPKNIELKVGQQLQIQQPDGSSILVTVVKLDEATATFDANHPLAGKDITFSIELLEIL